jgi:hypothetical protein
MKQCPNPNCILYTRLEELPDAYVKCPGCGGALVDANLTTSNISSGLFTRTSLSSSLLSGYEEQGEYAGVFEQPPPAYVHSVQAPVVAGEYTQYGHTQAYHYGEATPIQTYLDPASPRRLGIGRLLLLFSVLLLSATCLSTGIVVGTRIFNAQREVASGDLQAVHTALPSGGDNGRMPVPPIPTFETPSGVQPTPVPSEPQREPLTSIPEQAPTPPPAQTAPTGGVLDARMALELEGGQPAGNVRAYRPTDAFHLAVQANYGPGGVTSITTRWYGPDGHQIYEVRKEFTQAGTYYAGFTLRKTSLWPTGDYRVDIHANDSPTPDYTLYFSVVP